MIPRPRDESDLRALLRRFPATALLGPRQCGKTTLARAMRPDHFFDLENPRDARRLEQPQLALEDLRGLIVIDEVQRRPEIFELLRHMIDRGRGRRFLLLGSSSAPLARAGAETLAGRIAFHHLGGLRPSDVGESRTAALWLRGGFPRSFTRRGDADSLLWRENFTATFLERDIPQWGPRIPAPTLRRFWTMLCHAHGQVVNLSELGRSFGVSDMTVRAYLDVLSAGFMVRQLQPWHANLGKRLVRRPKIYIRDSGLLHALLSIGARDELLSHPIAGASWEGFALESLAAELALRPERCHFWATHNGAELDFFWQSGGRNWGAEFKLADAPAMTPSMRAALGDLRLEHLWVIYPGRERYRLDRRVTVLPLSRLREISASL